MKNLLLIIFLLLLTTGLFPQNTDFYNLFVSSELNPLMIKDARNLAQSENLPVLIYIKNQAFIEARGVENGKVIYTVIRDFLNPYINGSVMFFQNISTIFDLSKAKLIYNNGIIKDYTGENHQIILSPKTMIASMLLVMDSYNNKVLGLDTETGDIIDTSFIPGQGSLFSTYKVAIQSPQGRIFISDQVNDVVYEYDTAGNYIGIYAPQGGPNTSILDNIRGIGFRPNHNMLVTVGSSANQNTLQEFTTSGSHIGTFISTPPLTSPFDVIFAGNQYYVTSSTTSSGAVRIGVFDSTGTYLSPFTTRDSTKFCQQIQKLNNGNFIVATYSIPGSGLQIFSPDGTFLRHLSGVTANRGVFQLGNGNFVTTNPTGLYEIDDTTGALVRTIISGASVFAGQYITKYVPGPVTNIHHNSNTATGYSLEQNYPNPFNPVTKINFRIPERVNVKLSVFDILGKEIYTPVNNFLSPGSYSVDFNGVSLSSGVYFYKLSAGDFISVKKMTIIR